MLATDLVSILSTPINTDMPAPMSDELAAFVACVNRAHEVGKLEVFIDTLRQHSSHYVPASTPTIADKVARKSQDKADWRSRPASKSQIRRLNACCDDPAIWEEYYEMGQLTAGEASDIYADYKARIAAAA